ncbi:hypothetical protein Tco_0686068 [Tanacetum coccineum]
MGIRHAKPYMLRGGPSMKLEQSEDYDEEREMEPRPEPTRAATPPFRVTSPRIRGRPLEEAPRGNGGQSVNLPPLLAAHLGRGENGKPLQSSLTSAYGGQALPNNIGGNLPSNGLMEKTYTWVEARERTENKDRFSPYRRPNHGLLPSQSKSPKEILTMEKAARSFKPPSKMFRTYKETEELTKAGILWKVKHQRWVANPVMVKKSDGGWRMCMDFTDINKACPKDCYPLPVIDCKIESLLGFHLKCFLDAYKGYHQIQMAEEDEDKTAFYAGEGVFATRRCRLVSKMQGQHTKATILQSFSATLHISNIDYMYIKSYGFRLFSSLPAIYSGVVSPLATRKVHVHGRLKTISTLSTLNIGLVNPLAPRKGKFHGGLMTMSTLCT